MVPKADPKEVVRQVFDALETGHDEVLADDVSRQAAGPGRRRCESTHAETYPSIGGNEFPQGMAIALEPSDQSLMVFSAGNLLTGAPSGPFASARTHKSSLSSTASSRTAYRAHNG